ncbi:anhydro-N-acetylmuramic acid kinase [Ekhidna sp.]|uniref:anhydro-N-acetylmuramic acid kinase n=1 Tax=Ekhidna sp. TaxID=2608089 RepID=UPI003BA9E3B2
MKKNSYQVIGAMAGSSMDGLDIACIEFYKNETWGFRLIDGNTFPYNEEIKIRLTESPNESKTTQNKLDDDFGIWIAEQINNFKENCDHIDLIAIHGHTVIHKPNEGISWQLGNGEIIAEKCKTLTITDFRSEDIRLGGQGAPLVPFGDFTLFEKYDACINLGGISNISLKASQTAWDICPCNQVLNFFAKKLGCPFDEGGELGRKGAFNQEFYNRLSAYDFFLKSPPKSLPNQYFEQEHLNQIDPYDGLHTYCHFIAKQIASNISQSENLKILITGGGAHNTFLIEQIKSEINNCAITIPDEKIIEFKEAIIFGFLGMKKLRGEPNILSSVTGASKDSSSGVIHLP